MKHRYSAIIGLAALWACVIATAGSIATPALAQSALEDACSETGSQFNSDNNECHYTTTLEMDIQQAVEFADRPFIKQTIDASINQSRVAFVQEYADIFTQLDPPPYSSNYTLIMEYTTETREDGILNVIYTEYYFTGGAHGNTVHHTYLFNAAGDQLLTLADVLPDTQAALEAIAPLAQASLVETLGDDGDSEWIAQGTAPDEANYSAFILRDDEIVFIFEQYQVTYYAAGPQEVAIPLSEIAAFLNPALDLIPVG